MRMKILLLAMMSVATVAATQATGSDRVPMDHNGAVGRGFAIAPALASSFTQSTQLAQGYSSQTQQTQVDIDAVDLASPHILEITASGVSQLSGEVLLDGVVIKTLSGEQLTIDLADYLETGSNMIEVMGRYSPASASVQLTLDGPGLSLSQQTSGSGHLSQTFVLEVW
ncbi:MAG: hypothetical protein AAF921_18285 [Cyanobacteria bacterium P01_D01_bin.44]